MDDPDAAVIEKSSPVPARASFCGLLAALSLRVTIPVRVPPAVGLKLTLTVQLPLEVSVAPQVLVSAKSPLILRLLMFRVTLPVFLTVIVCATLWDPTICPLKVRFPGEVATDRKSVV